MSKTSVQGVRLSDLRKRVISDAKIDLGEDFDNQVLTMTFKADFHTPESEEALSDPKRVFGAVAKNIADNVVDWDMTDVLTDENGIPVDLEGSPIPEGAEPVIVKCPITEAFVRTLGSDLLQAIHHGMFQATRPNAKNS